MSSPSRYSSLVISPAVKNTERLAAEFSTDPEEILPEPGMLETGRAYREKKAKLLLTKIVQVRRSLYRAYIGLKGEFERQQGDYGRVRESNEHLFDRLQEVKMENKALRGVAADYERVKRAFGSQGGGGGGGGRKTAGTGGEGAEAIYTTKDEIGHTIIIKKRINYIRAAAAEIVNKEIIYTK